MYEIIHIGIIPLMFFILELVPYVNWRKSAFAHTVVLLRLRPLKLQTEIFEAVQHKCTIFYFNVRRPPFKYGMAPYDYESISFKRHRLLVP